MYCDSLSTEDATDSILQRLKEPEDDTDSNSDLDIDNEFVSN